MYICIHVYTKYIICIYAKITIIPKPEGRDFGGSLTQPQFKVTSAEVAVICPAFFRSPLSARELPVFESSTR